MKAIIYAGSVFDKEIKTAYAKSFGISKIVKNPSRSF